MGARTGTVTLGVLLAVAGGLTAFGALAQETPGAIPDPSTYKGSMELQRQEHERDQQFQQQQQQNFGAQAYPQQRSGGGLGGQANPVAVWARRPPLPPAKNPLLGRWHPIASARPASAGAPGSIMDMANALVGGTLQGACDSMFGHGVIEFRPATLVSVGRDGAVDVLDHVDYRGGGQVVAVLPKDPGSIGVLVFDFQGDRIVARALGCTMERAGASGATPASAPAARPAGPAAPAGPASAAVLSLAAGVAQPNGEMAPAGNASFYLEPHNVDRSLSNAGFQAPPGLTPLSGWVATCQTNRDLCLLGVKAMEADAVAHVKTDAAGHLVMPPVPPGRYYIFSFAAPGGRPLLWDLPVDLKPGANSIVLDEHNVRPVR